MPKYICIHFNELDIFAARVKDIDSYGIIKKKSIQGENFVSLAELYGYGGLRGIFMCIYMYVYIYIWI
jgi:hypothetical protein